MKSASSESRRIRSLVEMSEENKEADTVHPARVGSSVVRRTRVCKHQAVPGGERNLYETPSEAGIEGGLTA